MSSIIDPITGLPYDALDTTLYSIPLDSQPALAPEWNPQGRISSTVYPDNLPTVFATMQAQNETNESTVQACSTDGAGNLNVNVKAQTGGGGGATPIRPTNWVEGGALTGTGIDPTNFGPLRLSRSKLLWVFGGSAVLFADPGANNWYGYKTLGLMNTKDQAYLPLVVITFFLAKTGSIVTSHMAGEGTITYPNGLDLTTMFAAGADIAFASGGGGSNAEVYAFAVQ